MGLDNSTLVMVADVVEYPPEEKKYDALKNGLLRAYRESEDSKLTRLLADLNLGDEKPPHLQ